MKEIYSIHALKLLPALILLTLCVSCAPERAEVVVPPPPPSPTIASIGDSNYTLDRLRQWLASHPDTLARVEIEEHLHEWVESQIYVQEAVRLGLLDNPGIAEELAELRRRYLRGLLEEHLLRQDVEISDRAMKRWARNNRERLLLKERQVKFAWYASADSNQLAEIALSIAGNRLQRAQLAEIGLSYGKTPFIEMRELDPRIAPALFDMEYLELSTIMALDGNFLLYQVVGNRPVGYQLPVESAEGEIRQMMEQEKRMAFTAKRLEELRSAVEYQIALDPLFEIE